MSEQNDSADVEIVEVNPPGDPDYLGENVADTMEGDELLEDVGAVDHDSSKSDGLDVSGPNESSSDSDSDSDSEEDPYAVDPEFYDEERFWRKYIYRRKRICCLWQPNFGVGLSLYMNQLCLSAVLAGIMAIFGVYLMITYGLGCEDLYYLCEQSEEDGNVLLGRTYCSDGILSKITRCPSFGFGLKAVPMHADIVIFLFALFLFAFVMCCEPCIQGRVAQFSVRRSRNYSDYSVWLRNLNKKTTVEQLFNVLVRKHGLRVRKIIMIPTSSKLWRRSIRREGIYEIRRTRPAWFCCPWLWSWRLRWLDRQIEKIEDKAAVFEKCREAYVTFHTVQDSLRCARRLNVHPMKHPISYKPWYYIPPIFARGRLLRHQLMRVQLAPHPDDMILANSRYPRWKSKVRGCNLWLVVVLALILVVIGATIISIADDVGKIYYVNELGSSNWSFVLSQLGSVLLSIITLSLDFGGRITFRLLGNFGKCRLRTEYEVATMTRIALARIAIVVVIYAFGKDIYGQIFLADFFPTAAIGSRAGEPMALSYYYNMSTQFMMLGFLQLFTSAPVIPVLRYMVMVLQSRSLLTPLHKQDMSLANGYSFLCVRMFVMFAYAVWFPVLFLDTSTHGYSDKRTHHLHFIVFG